MREVAGFIGLGLALLLHGACASDSGGSDGSGGTASGSPFGTSSCGTCVATACQAERTACLSDPGCSGFASCLDACPTEAGGNVDAACASACPTPASSAGVAAKGALETCRTSGPGAACAACGGSADAGDGAPALNPILAPQGCSPSSKTGCQACFDESCCKLRSACLGDPSCDQLSVCVAGCSGWTCELACYEAHPDAVAKYSQYYGCVSVFCPGDDQDCKTTTNTTIDCIVVDECKQEYSDCYSQAECYLITQCAMDCEDAACFDACKNAYPSGVAAFGAMTLCWEKKCGFAT